MKMYLIIRKFMKINNRAFSLKVKTFQLSLVFL